MTAGTITASHVRPAARPGIRNTWHRRHTAVENSSCTRPGTAAHRIAAAARDARQDEKAGNAENAEGIKEGNAGSGRKGTKGKAAAAEPPARADAANLAGRGEQGADALTGINAYGYAGVGIKVSIKRGVGGNRIPRARGAGGGAAPPRGPRVRYH
jgi:hypothetical protein